MKQCSNRNKYMAPQSFEIRSTIQPRWKTLKQASLLIGIDSKKLYKLAVIDKAIPAQFTSNGGVWFDEDELQNYTVQQLSKMQKNVVCETSQKPQGAK